MSIGFVVLPFKNECFRIWFCCTKWGWRCGHGIPQTRHRLYCDLATESSPHFRGEISEMAWNWAKSLKFCANTYLNAEKKLPDPKFVDSVGRYIASNNPRCQILDFWSRLEREIWILSGLSEWRHVLKVFPSRSGIFLHRNKILRSSDKWSRISHLVNESRFLVKMTCLNKGNQLFQCGF